MSIRPDDTTPRATPEFLSGGGEMGERIRALDWTQTPLGAPQGWPQSLKTAVRIMLTSRQPIWIGWGEELTYFYNDPYKSIIGEKHPHALGRPARIVWREIWDVIEPMLSTAMRGDEGTYVESQLLIMERYGYREETYYTFSYSPIPDDDGGAGGIICANTDDTQRVIGARRLQTLRDLSERTLAGAKTPAQACERAVATLAENAKDLTFAAIYLLSEDGKAAELCGVMGLTPGGTAAPQNVGLNSDSDVWGFGATLAEKRLRLVENLAEKFGWLPGSAWPDDATRQAAVVPLARAGVQEFPAGFLVAGVSPRLRFDEDYRGFVELVGGHLATAVASARAYEEERRRAESLAELDRAKTTFFSNVSHEFRTPLTLMLGPLEEALANGNGRLPPAEREQIALAHRNGLRLLKLVNTLLDFSRIEAGRAQAVYEPVDLAAYTAELASAFRSAVERAGLRFVVNCLPLSEPSYVDREMWEKVVLNLLSNAFKFTLKGEIEVSLEEKEERVELRVRDTGTGIPAEELPHVFERFHRVKGARGRTHEGTGIGLALVRELVKLHGGAVTVESTYGRGTTFTVSLPKGAAHLPPDRVEGARALASTSLGATPFIEEALRWLPADGAGAGPSSGDFILDVPGADGHPPLHPTDGARVLLADDNADMRDYVRRLLAGRYEVEAVADGQAALDAAREHVPDLVLTDVMMPRLDGFGLLRELRGDQRTRTVPVILLSARAGEESRVEGLEAGADDYLVKPFSARELLARVRANLEMARLQREFTAELREREEELQEAQRVGRIGSWLWDAKTDETAGSDELLRIYGLDPAADRMPNFAEQDGHLYPPESWERIDEAVRSALETGAGYELDVQAFRKGAPIWVTTRGEVVRDPEGKVVGLRGTVQDITERKRAEEELLYQSQLTRNIADTAAVSIFVSDAEGRTTFINPEAERVFGYTPAELEGEKLHDKIHYRRPDGRPYPMSECPLGRVYKTGETVRDFEDEFYRKDGTPVAVVCSNAPIVEHGVVTGVVLTVQDITELRRLLEAERASRQQAEEANRLKDEFLATVSHELRTPLTAILGWTHILRVGELDVANAARALETVERNARAQQQLIEDLLDVSRVITGKLRLDIRPCDPVSFIESAVDAVRPAAEAKGVRLQRTLDTSAGAISGDPNRLQQVVWNLLSNAVKFTPRGGRVHVRLERVNSHVEIIVTDTGAGIATEFLPHVFERFRQADMGTTRQHGGLGLGLAIVRHLVEMHGGEVRADSRGDGQGSTFTVKLPIIPVYERGAEGERVHPKADRALSPVESADRLDGLKVLVVDDEPDTCELLRMLLTRCGAEAVTATSAEGALARMADSRFDLLVSDIGMPGADGYELIRRVRELPPVRGGLTPAVALTAYARAEDRMRALRAGYQMHVAKPVEPAELIAVMASLAKRSSR